MNKLFYLIPVLLVLFFTYGIITKKETNPLKKEKRVTCQKKTITFEKIHDKENSKVAIKLLKSSNFLIKSRIEQSKYMKSQILNHISLEKSDNYLLNSIKPYLKTKVAKDKKLIIDYYIYENDKEDKGKKGTKCKLYAGYLVFEFKLEEKLLYKIQTDYMKMDTSDIPERMDCVIKSFISLNKN